MTCLYLQGTRNKAPYMCKKVNPCLLHTPEKDAIREHIDPDHCDFKLKILWVGIYAS